MTLSDNEVKILMVIKFLVSAKIKHYINTVVGVCSLPPMTGPCRGHLIRYYYNPSSRRCETFIYGGCRGNDNRFDSLRECENVCGKAAISGEFHCFIIGFQYTTHHIFILIFGSTSSFNM